MESIISQYQVPFLRVGSFLERFPEGIYSIIQNTGGLFVPEKIGANEQLQPHFLVRGVLKNSPTGRIKIKKVGSLLFISWKDSEEVTPIERRVREIHQDWFFHKDTIYSGSYRTNMFHLLNPLHLKSVHKLSQNGIVLDQVTGYIPTDNGGILEFDSRIDRKEEQKIFG
ncbi:hypothetical protein HC766_02330 [Candidatus Gracilibacteria bacterium]|nr:hypothetical protein [Candidatus Gracilibacteria bacterium]